MAEIPPTTGNRWIGIVAVGAVLLFIFGTAGLLLLDFYGRPSAEELAERDLKRIASAVAEYEDRHGVLPQSLMDLSHGAHRTATKLPRQDPWGRPYVYVRSEHAWEIRTAGVDGVPQNEDDQRAGGSLRLPRREAAIDP